MAANVCRVYWDAEIALVANTAKTVLMITAAANIALIFYDWSVAFDGVSSTGQPILVEVAKYSTAGTATGSAKISSGNGRLETPQFTAGYNFTAEPTITLASLWDVQNIHPQTGAEFRPPTTFILAGGERLGIRCTADAAVNVRPRFTVEE